MIGSNPNLLQPGMVLFIPPLKTPADTSKGNPALADFNGALYLAWTGTDARGSLNIASSTDNGANFGQKTTLNATSSTGPALAAFNNQLFIAWTGTDQNPFNVQSSTDGVHFS